MQHDNINNNTNTTGSYADGLLDCNVVVFDKCSYPASVSLLLKRLLFKENNQYRSLLIFCSAPTTLSNACRCPVRSARVDRNADPSHHRRGLQAQGWTSSRMLRWQPLLIQEEARRVGLITLLSSSHSGSATLLPGTFQTAKKNHPITIQRN